VTFAPNGQIFVTEKSGLIWSYTSLSDPSPVRVADLRTQVHDYWDRGLLGLAVPPGYPADNHLYALYAYDAAIGGTAPRWNDVCPSPPGPTTDGCLVSGRLSRLTITNGVSTGEQVLINDWCQQYPSHSVGALAFGSDGYLYVSGGDGASFNNVDYGQYGATNAGGTANPCGDPPGAIGTALTAPTAQGGALRSQSPRRAAGPTTLDGAVLRLDPATGLGAPGNPYAGSSDANKARVIAYGLRNPFRFAMRPGTREMWIGDVGVGRLRRAQSSARHQRRGGRELRLALLRGRRSAGRLRQRRTQPVHQPLQHTRAPSRRRTTPTATAPLWPRAMVVRPPTARQ
jgi:glucose/arabinose dehydrogenase